MISLVLDTNILHQEGFISGRMQLLKKLIDVEFVRLFIPELVKNEFITKRINNTSEAMMKSANGLKTISSNFELSTDFKNELKEIEDNIRLKNNDVKEKISEEFENWSKDFRVKELLFNPEDIKLVMNDYFSGNGVYRSIKSRDDIPDAMINTCIDKLISDVGNISVIIKDGVFRKHLENNKSVTIFDGLSDFLKTEAVEALKEKADEVEIVREYLESNEAAGYFYNYFKNLDGEESWIYVEDSDLINKEVIADRVYNAEINSAINENIENLKVSNLYALTGKKFVGDLSFEIQSTVHFISDYGIFIELDNDKDRNVEMDSMNGDGICDLFEEYQVRYSGQIEISFEEIFEKSVVKVLMKDIKHNEGVVKVEFDIESCELLLDDA